MPRSILVSLVLFLALPAWAHSEVDARNRVSFQVEATRAVANDWATARFSVLAEGKDPATVANSVNTAMKSALAAAKRSQGVEVRSGAYVTQPVYEHGRVVRWRARQELRVESGDVERLSQLTTILQGKSVVLSGIDFSVKRETRVALEEELIAEALAAFRARAALVAKGMDAASWSLVELSIGRTGGQPPMRHMRDRPVIMSASKTAPAVFEAGSSEIRIQVDGRIELD